MMTHFFLSLSHFPPVEDKLCSEKQATSVYLQALIHHHCDNFPFRSMLRKLCS